VGEALRLGGHEWGSHLGEVGQQRLVAIPALLKFAGTIAGQRDFLELQQQLAGATSPVDQLKVDQELLKQLLPNRTTDFDLDSQAGRDAFRRELQADLEAFKNGIDPSEVHGSLDDFKAIASDSANALNSFNDATNAAVNAMLNVPTGFKLASDRFKATLDQSADAFAKAGGAFSGAPRGNPFAPPPPAITPSTRTAPPWGRRTSRSPSFSNPERMAYRWPSGSKKSCAAMPWRTRVTP